jgi:hypothetical protein
LSNKLPAGWEKSLPSFTPEDKGLATRLHSQTMLNALAPALPGESLRFAFFFRGEQTKNFPFQLFFKNLVQKTLTLFPLSPFLSLARSTPTPQPNLKKKQASSEARPTSPPPT